MKINIKFVLTLLVSILMGLVIYWVNTLPNWDDAGIIATSIVLTSAVISYFYKTIPLVWGLAISCWIPVFGIIKTGDYKMLLILLFGLIGSLGGYFVRKLMIPAKPQKKKK